ncbi:hypothetical protein BJY04DRAFT_190187 [Aspergillus karnatakaensis]|uniref:uncharacterized protein n=1 Tax=Aspergillus karnatakaensis TaxID=1810916 RepID=UPI003CCD5AF7
MSFLESALQYTRFHLPDKSLQSFCWRLGCCDCVPWDILSADEWLAFKQGYIQSLSLTTGGTCYHIQWRLDGLLQLDQLRFFSWQGIHQTDQTILDALRRALVLNAEHLEKLELEAVEETRFDSS